MEFFKSVVTMETIYDEEESDDNIVLIKLERDFSISANSENVFCLYRVSYENISLLSGEDSFPELPEKEMLEYDVDRCYSTGKGGVFQEFKILLNSFL